MINLIDKTSIDESRIEEVAIDYINYSLPNPEDIYNRITFSGCLRHIYKTLFKPSDYDICINNQRSKIPYQDIVSLQSAYNAFIDLCCKYKKEYTLNSFCAMTGLSNKTIMDWSEGRAIPDYVGNEIPRNTWVLFAQKLRENSEQALSESMLQGNLMAYATLKCWFSWSESPQQIAITGTAPTQNAAQIAQKYQQTQLAPPPPNAENLSVYDSET